jgi:hypothetical protein
MGAVVRTSWNKGHGPGTRLRHDGYVQITRHGPWRWCLEHVKVMLEACREMCYYPVEDGLPPGFTVEHLNHNRAHNCMCNLMLLDKRIHDVLSIEHRWRRSRALRAENAAYAADGGVPDWVTSDTTV